MSHPAIPAPPQAPQRPEPPPNPPQGDARRVAEDLIALSRNTSRGLAHDTPSSSGADTSPDLLGKTADDAADYWYRLGLRNAYAQAAGLLIAPAAAADPFTVAERITTRIDAGVTDVAELSSAAYGSMSARPGAALEWHGERAFAARYGDRSPAERDYGMRWGPRGDQRITLRPNNTGDRGLLYVYDPTWDEYALLAADVARGAVEAAFRDAVEIDIHLDPARFARIVEQHAVTHESRVPDLGRPPMEVQL